MPQMTLSLRRNGRRAILTLAMCLAALPASAQFGGGMPGPSGPGGGPGGGPRRDTGERREKPARGEVAMRPSLLAQIEERLVDVRTRLALAPEQVRYWEAYQNRVGALVADMMRPPTAQAADSAPRQIDRQLDVVRNRLAALEDIHDAAVRLYAVLNAAQRVTADTLLSGTVPPIYQASAGEVAEPGDRSGRPGGREPPPR